MRLALLLAALAVLPACGGDHGLLLDVTADSPFTRLRVEVKGDDDRPFFWEEFDVPADPMRDLTTQPYRLGIKLPSSGRYGVHVTDISAGPASQSWSGSFQVSGVVEGTAHLRSLVAGSDMDGDGWQTGCWPDAPPADCALADCNDADPGVNPFAIDTCGNGVDEDCSGADSPCEDKDEDGYDESVDCDDDDPDVHPRDPGFCEGVDPYCDNGKDEDCSGTDAACGTDEDCDGYEACAGMLGDCDCNDSDPDIRPDATEICQDVVDQDCDGNPDNGCDRCDEDGDGWYGDHPERGCSVDPASRDCDDTDRGINPGATDDCGGQEGSAPCTIRGYCAGGVDEDCDGMVNEGCPAPGCDADGDGFAPAACGPAPAATDCNDADPNVYPGAPDVCGDGIMQNCSIDLACASDADMDGYNAAADCDDTDNGVHPGGVETCDGVDQDCDGLVDEGNPSMNPGESLDTYACNDDNDGSCAPVVGRCVCSATIPDSIRQDGNRVVCPMEVDALAPVGPRCFGAPQPTSELCNGADDDCDALTDDATIDIGDSCGATEVGECSFGTTICSGGSIMCDGYVGPVPESCDMLDNDCDGSNDDGLGLGTSCDGGDTDFCLEGTMICNGSGGVVCSDGTGSTTELCNALDDDCDGTTDEGFNVGMACDGTDGDTCNEGNLACNAAGTGTVCTDTTSTNVESCNGFDDDCDGTTDEGFALGVACDGADLDLCLEGVTVCNGAGTGTVCSDVSGSNMEICNFADDDCDGSIDEGFTLGMPCDGSDSDMCIEGVTECDGIGTRCSDMSTSTTELCNGADDDCDGSTDEMAACGSGLTCMAASCVCTTTSCSGCCASGTSCSGGTSLSSCGSGGGSCTNCTVGMFADNCSMGMCRCGTGAACTDLLRTNNCGGTGGPGGTATCRCGTGAACSTGQLCCSGTCMGGASCP
jgi:hypothetical protein